MLTILKQAELGAEVETSVPRPIEDGEPRSYRPTVLRTRRVAVEAPDVRRQLDNLVRRRKPILVRWLDTMLTTSKEDISFDEIASAFATGNVDGAYLNRWRERYARYLTQKVVPAWDAAQTAGARVMIPGIEGMLDDTVEFALLGERMDRWSRERAATLVVGLSDTQRTALGAMVRQFSTFDRRNPREVARFIRPLIGLTPRDAASLARQERERIEKGIESDADIKRDIANQALTRIRRRAETIAETELAYAYNFGGWHAVRDADAEGAFGTDTPVKVLWAQQDERTCPFCGPLHGTQIGMDETFPGRTNLVPNTFSPPLHPRCRCVLLYEFIEADEDAIEDVAEETPPGAVPGPDGEPVVYNAPLDEAEFNAIVADELAYLKGVIDDAGIDFAEQKRLKDETSRLLDEQCDGKVSWDEYISMRRQRDALNRRIDGVFEALIDDERQGESYADRLRTDTFAQVKQPTNGDTVFGDPYDDEYRRQAPREKTACNNLQREMAAYWRRSLPPGEVLRNHVDLEIGAIKGQGRAWQRSEPSCRDWHTGAGRVKVAVNVGGNVRTGDGRRVVYHELGHTLEILNGRVSDAARIFYRQRTRGESLAWIGHGYSRSEKTRRDKFYSAYVGKEYYAVVSSDLPETRTTEVVSMALDRFADGASLAKLAADDLEHLAFGMAILKGRFGWRP